jgi:hypothetical protein
VDLPDPEKSQPYLGKFYRIPRGSANPEPKIGSEKFAEACSKKIEPSSPGVSIASIIAFAA